MPLGVASAIYVSEIASRHEKRFIKPYIEFISAIPSVVLGFFGIAVVGQAVRPLSQSHSSAGCRSFRSASGSTFSPPDRLLALMAVPTIFTLSEDALRNVPRGFKEASYALGANRLQTIARVLVPASLSGIVSAMLLGLGPRDRRDDGGASLRGKSDRDSRFHRRASARFFNRCTQ